MKSSLEVYHRIDTQIWMLTGKARFSFGGKHAEGIQHRTNKRQFWNYWRIVRKIIQVHTVAKMLNTCHVLSIHLVLRITSLVKFCLFAFLKMRKLGHREDALTFEWPSFIIYKTGHFYEGLFKPLNCYIKKYRVKLWDMNCENDSIYSLKTLD